MRKVAKIKLKKFIFEMIILGFQLFLFYIFPLFLGPTDVIGMVLFMISATVLLSLVIGCVSTHQIRFFYPFVTAIIFIPSVFLYYNESALVHSVWYLVVSSVGMLLGSITKLWNKNL